MFNKNQKTMRTTTNTESRTTTVTKTIESNGVTISVSRRFINLLNPFVSELEYSIEYGTFRKTRMSRHSFDFHLQMIKDGMIK